MILQMWMSFLKYIWKTIGDQKINVIDNLKKINVLKPNLVQRQTLLKVYNTFALSSLYMAVKSDIRNKGI
jgi:hypothetical protein